MTLSRSVHRADADPGRSDDAWSVLVDETVESIRVQLGQTAADVVAATLQERSDDARLALGEQEAASHHLLERAMTDLVAARRGHERLQADIARMEKALGALKADAARVRTETNDYAARRRAEIDAAQAEIRDREADLAARADAAAAADRDLAERAAALDTRAARLEEQAAALEADRLEAGRLVAESLDGWQAARAATAEADELQVRAAAALAAAEAEREETARALAEAREHEAEARDLRRRQELLDQRTRELEAWEADLVGRSRTIDLRHDGAKDRHPSRAGWGRSRPASADT